MLLSDLSYDQTYKHFMDNYKWSRRFLALCLTCAGLFIASYPGEHPEWSNWSDIMRRTAHYIFPPNVNVGKRYTAIGVDMIIAAIFLTHRTKDVLSSRVLLWLGKQSFAVYLVHGTLLRVPLVWMLYGISGQPWEETVDAEGNVKPPPWIHIREPWVVGISIPCWLILVYICAAMWTQWVDPFCAKMTQKIEDRFFERTGDEKSAPMEQAAPPLLPLVNQPLQPMPMN
jgi:hypothetical protein